MNTQQSANELLEKHIQSINLRKHVYAVEAAMRFYAKKFNEDEDLWGNAGLLHDLDYEKFPDTHPELAMEWLRELKYDEKIPQAIHYHAEHNPKEFPTLLDKTLWACDELTGFIIAVALVRPSKKLFDLEVSSVKKKMKEKSFAKPVSREDLLMGAEILGISIEEHIENVLVAMKGISDKLGL